MAFIQHSSNKDGVIYTVMSGLIKCDYIHFVTSALLIKSENASAEEEENTVFSLQSLLE